MQRILCEFMNRWRQPTLATSEGTVSFIRPSGADVFTNWRWYLDGQGRSASRLNLQRRAYWKPGDIRAGLIRGETPKGWGVRSLRCLKRFWTDSLKPLAGLNLVFLFLDRVVIVPVARGGIL